MWEVLAADGGVGLAAPQIGVLERLVVVRDPDQPPGRQRLDLVNPVITGLFGPPVPFEEGCLSFPGLYTTIRRPRGVRLEYHDAAGRPGRLSNDSLVARIVQHEVDHLNGVLFIDHLSAWGKFRAGPRLLLILLLKLLGK
jgi:peptide deformylase